MLKKLILVLLIIATFMVADALAEPYLIETKEVVIESNQIPAEFDGKKIVFLSDIHYGPFFDKGRLESLVNQTNALNPDLILLGGDYVTNDPAYVESAFASLSKLKAPLGVYGVLGNNDPENSTINAMSQAGITYIGNKGVWIEENNSRIRIGGVGDLDTDVQNQGATTLAANESDFLMLVSHKPEYFPQVKQSKVDVVLSGHTHGGQFTLFGLWAPFYDSKYGEKYLNGVMKFNNTTLIVSNGIGTVSAPVRFFARPQIIVVKLKRKS
jgi:uncharacterized protein